MSIVYSDLEIPSSLTRAFTAYDDGRTQLLICVHGLLGINYRNSSYNIPVAIWITREYPRQSPIAYVVPTADMLVRADRYVDPSGRCQTEYMQAWERKSEVRTPAFEGLMYTKIVSEYRDVLC